MNSHDPDLIIRNGTLVDGCGGEPFKADVAMRDGKIITVGSIAHKGREEIDATGCIVTPGFVDIHTHYDGHVTWASHMAPSANHGVTTVVMGNCGVGFAPCKPEDRDNLVRLMEGVEEIPEPVMSEGLPWDWESFPQYLDTLGRRQFDLDIAPQLPHAPLRVFVMGQRAVDREPATPEDIARMAEIAQTAVRAGALGFSTTRTLNHRTTDGSPTPVLTAGEDELTGIAMALAEIGQGVLQLISDFDDAEREFDMLERIVTKSRRPLSISLMQVPQAPDRWQYLLSRIEQASQRGLPIKGQVAARPVGSLMGLELSRHPFTYCRSYAAIAKLPFAERVKAMRDPKLRAKLIAEFPTVTDDPQSGAVILLDRSFEMGDDPEYEPTESDSVAARAAEAGLSPVEFVYDLLLKDGGKTILYRPVLNYVDGNIDAVEEMMRHPDTVLGLGDGGAHCKTICDASLTTYMLTRWVKSSDATSLSLPQAIRAMTSETAALVGLNDRGLLKPGYKSDINVIDLDRLTLRKPEIIYDLPAGGGRLGQRARGFRATIVSGTVTYWEGWSTGRLPGRLVRGQRTMPVGRFTPTSGQVAEETA